MQPVDISTLPASSISPDTSTRGPGFTAEIPLPVAEEAKPESVQVVVIPGLSEDFSSRVEALAFFYNGYSSDMGSVRDIMNEKNNIALQHLFSSVADDCARLASMTDPGSPGGMALGIMAQAAGSDLKKVSAALTEHRPFSPSEMSKLGNALSYIEIASRNLGIVKKVEVYPLDSQASES